MTSTSSATPGRLIDGGANICITGDLDSLFDVVAIPPLSISVAMEGASSLDDCCTARGMTPIQLDDGSIYWQACYFCANAVETIISPQAIVDSSDVFQSWHQTGYRCGVSTPGCIRFDSHDGLLTMSMTLVLHDGLHYCPTDVYAVDTMPASRFSLAVRRVACPDPLPVPGKSRSHERFIPASKAKQVESEVWLLRLGSPGIRQLDMLPGRVTGIPLDFKYHPFHYIDHKEHASIKKRPAQRSAVRTSDCKRRFYMDFGFMRASTSDYARPNKSTDRVVSSYDGYTLYLLVIDEAYAEFSYEVSALELLADRPRLVVSRTMSKAFAFAGARVGYLAADAAVVDALRIVRLPYHLSALTQAAARAALRHSGEMLANVEQIKFQRDRMITQLTTMGLRAYKSDANFVLVEGFDNPQEVFEALLAKGVIIRNVGIPNTLRITAGTEAETSKLLGELALILD